MANTVDKILKVAEAEVGYLEKSASAYKKDPKVLDKKTEGAGYDNYTKYGRDMHKIYPQVMDFPAPWCDAFFDYCCYMAYGVATAKSLLGGNFDDYTVASAQMYKEKGAYHYTKDGYVPRVGDQIFFRNSTGICHTGLVYKVDQTWVYTIEGNTSSTSGVVANGGGVFKKQYVWKNNPSIDGYGSPKYDVEKPKSTTNAKITAKCNFYKKKNTWDGYYKTLKVGTKINATSDCKDGWSKVKIGDNEGYVKNSCIALDSKKELSTYPTKQTIEEVALRTDRKVDKSTKVKTLPKGTKFKAVCKGGDWVQAKISGKDYYLWLAKTNA